MPDEAHIIFKPSDTSIHPIKVSIHRIKTLTHKCSKIVELCEDFSQQRRSIPLWWRRWGTFVRNRRWQVLFANPLTINILSVTKGGNNTNTDGERPFNLDIWLIIQRNYEIELIWIMKDLNRA